jgi:hypothetical protein
VQLFLADLFIPNQLYMDEMEGISISSTTPASSNTSGQHQTL